MLVGSLFAIISSCLLILSIVSNRNQVIKNDDLQLQKDPSPQRRLVKSQTRMTAARRRLEEEIKDDPPPPAAANQTAPPPRLTEEETRQRIKAFLGGIYPHLDDDLLPKYLRDSMPRDKLSVMDVWNMDKDIIFFWHIPKVRKI